MAGEVISTDAGIEFFVFSPQGEPYSNAVHYQDINPVYTYRASNFPGGDWFVCMQLESPGGNATIHYNLDVDVTPSSRSEGGGLGIGMLLVLTMGALRRAALNRQGQRTAG